MSDIITDINVANRYLNGELDCWKPDRAHAAAYASRNPTPTFALACPKAMDREPLKDVFLPRLLVRACREKYGNDWQFYPQYQKRGTCHLAGTKITLADGNTRAIELVSEGDMVVSHIGAHRRVTDSGTRMYTGNIHSLTLHGVISTLNATAEHPVWARKRMHRTSVKIGGKWKTRVKYSDWDWIPISEIEPGDKVLMPKSQSPATKQIDLSAVLRDEPGLAVSEDQIKLHRKSFSRFMEMGEELGQLVGFYAAEGSSEDRRVTWTLNTSEQVYADQICQLVRQLFGLRCTTRVEAEKSVLRVRVCSRVVAKLMQILVPGTAVNKSLTAEALSAPIVFKRGLLSTWIDGDGHHTKRKLAVTGRTASVVLAENMQTVARDLDLIANNAVQVKKQKMRDGRTTKTAVSTSFYADSAVKLGHDKPRRHDRGHKNAELDLAGIAVKVKSNSKIFLTGVPVYALEVEEDHSYMASGVAVHNCVGQSHKVLADILGAVNRYVGGAKFLGRVAVAAIYGMSRVEIGGNPGSWDGSNGSWAAEALEKGAYLLLEELGLDPNPQGKQNYWKVCDQDEAKAVAWANSQGGVPAEYEKLAGLRPVTGASQVSTIEEVRASLSDLKPVNLCGQVHPSQDRGGDGIASDISRGGGHSTFLVGQYYDEKRGMWFYDHMQSWGDYYRGKYARQDSDFKEDLMFSTCITRIPEKWVMNWLGSRDCYSLHGLTGVEPVDDAFRILSVA